jgi:uncharacterized protein (TIGR03435 family)
MMRTELLVSILVLYSSSVWATPQNPAGAPLSSTGPAFQVATIKPSKPDAGLEIQIQGRRFATTGTSLVDILKYAYGLHSAQILGGPDWLRSEKFDVMADPSTETRPPSDQIKLMVQGLLAERFSLSFHREKRELPVYAIVVAKGGPKLTKSTREPGSIPAVSFSPTGRFAAANASVADIATFLQRYVLDKPVVDQTGLSGRFDVNVRWEPDEAVESTLPGFYTAVQEQLGLKLMPVKTAIDVFVVDNVEQPSAN